MCPWLFHHLINRLNMVKNVKLWNLKSLRYFSVSDVHVNLLLINFLFLLFYKFFYVLFFDSNLCSFPFSLSFCDFFFCDSSFRTLSSLRYTTELEHTIKFNQISFCIFWRFSVQILFAQLIFKSTIWTLIGFLAGSGFTSLCLLLWLLMVLVRQQKMF